MRNTVWSPTGKFWTILVATSLLSREALSGVQGVSAGLTQVLCAFLHLRFHVWKSCRALAWTSGVDYSRRTRDDGFTGEGRGALHVHFFVASHE